MKFIFTILFVMLMSMGAFAQQQSRADRMFERGDYLGAMKLYRKELDAGTGDQERTKARVANCLFHLNDVIRAGQLYRELDPDKLGADDLLYYAITLQRSGEYDKALGLVDMIESMGGDVIATERLRQSCRFAEQMKKEKPVYAANKTNINFAGFSAGVTYYKGKGVILAAPGSGENAMQDSKGYKFTRLYNAVFSGDGKGGRLIPFGEELVDKYHIGAVTFSKNFQRIYFTKTILKKDGTSILKLMTAENNAGKWENIQELNINSDDYSCAHPCLYRDSLLFFVSDMPGGYGGKDIYRTVVDGGECGEVQNLGAVINTEDDELFPFIDSDGCLFFASNGHVGLGGLDIFESRMTAEGWTEPRNMGRPINSSMDDFGLVFLDTKRTEGYVSSNRGGTGYNDFLFSLRILPSRSPKVDVPAPVDQKVVVDPKDMFKVDYRYAIQVGAFRNPVPRVYFDKFQNVKVYLGYDNIYRYTLGEYPEEQVAQNDLKEVRKMIGDAFVINVDSYIVQQKIRNDVQGDKISDDELLLIRLKNLEVQEKAKRNWPLPQKTHRYLEKPRDTEIAVRRSAYTVVLMSVNQVLDMSKFNGIREMDVYEVEDGSYRYCTGRYNRREDAENALQRARNLGFREAYVTNTSEYGYERKRVAEDSPSRDVHGMKELLKNL